MKRFGPLMCVTSLLLASACPTAGPRDAGVDDFDVELRMLVGRFGGAAQANDHDLELRRVRAALRSGRLGIDRTVLPRCLATTSDFNPLALASALSDSLRVVTEPPPGSDCEGLWLARTPTGQPCDTPIACAEGVCEGANLLRGGCGVCAARRGAGEACGPAGVCASGLTCVASPTGVSRCATVTLSGPGGPCPCQSDLRCDAGVCHPPLGESGACGFSDQLCTPPLRCLPTGRCGLLSEGDVCDKQGFCNVGAQCREPDPLAPGQWLVPTGPDIMGASGRCISGTAGVRCQYDQHCASGFICGFTRWRGACAPRVAPLAACEHERQCPPGFSCVTGACLPRVGPGLPCDGRSTCMAGTQCVAGRCSRQPRLGEVCSGTCNGSTCLDGTCVRRPDSPCLVGFDDACGSGRQCQQGTAAAGVGACTLTSGSAEPTACVLGDGLARDDFSGSADAAVEDEGPCLPTGPADLVIPLTAAQAQCVFSTQALCTGCHFVSGCPELRPRSTPAPPADHPSAGLARLCGVDAGR